MKNDLKILFVISSLEIGGAEKQMVALLSHLKKRGYSCYVFVLQTNGPLIKYLTDLDIPIYFGGLKKRDISRTPWKLIIAQWKLIRLLQQLKPHVLHSFLPLVTFMGALAGRLMRIPLVITSRRALGTHQNRFKILYPIDLAANHLSHLITVNSQAVWNDVVYREHLNPKKLVLIYNGVDVTLYETASLRRSELRKKMGITPWQKIVTVIANLIPYKGHLDFLKAAQIVVSQIPNAIFWLVGEDRGIQKDLKQTALGLGIYHRVNLLGRRNDIPDILAVSDLSVLPSHEEGFSNVILESMAAGLPVVATSVGGNPEAIVDGVTGWVVPPQDPLTMAKRIIDLLTDTQKAKSFGQKGRERVKELFSMEKMVDAYLKLYERSIDKNIKGND